MSVEDIIMIIVAVLYVISNVAIFIYKIKSNFVGTVSELIADAEKLDLTGAEKMESVVESIYKIIPAGFKKIFSEDKIQVIAQFVFDNMRDYAKNYLDRKLKELEANQTKNTDDTTAME